jgi:hypothetical protein
MTNLSKAPKACRRTETPLRTRMQLLRDIWLAHILKRAIAEVSQATDQDYIAFGLDRDDMLARLNCLREDVRNARRGGSAQLTIAIARGRGHADAAPYPATSQHLLAA